MRLATRLAAPVLLTAVLAVPTGCSNSSTDNTFTIVAAFYPLQFLAERVAGTDAEVVNLVKPGVEPHDLELTPDQMAKLTEADLVVYLRGFQPAVDEAVTQRLDAAADTFDAASVRPLLRSPDGEPDPHLWLDATRYAAVAEAMAVTLDEIRPDQRASYRKRAKALASELAALDSEFSDGLANCQRRDIVVSHAAYSYLAARYRLEQVAITGLSPEQEPRPQRLAEVAKFAREHDTSVIFFETLVSPKLAQTLADEVGARATVLDPLEGLNPGSRDDYFSVMRRNLTELRNALDCA